MGGGQGNPTWWKVRETVDLLLIKMAEAEVVKRMHGRARTEMRKKINEAVRVREESYAKGAMSKAIASITGKHRESYDMGAVTRGEERITGHGEVHVVITGHFEVWHNPPYAVAAGNDSYWDDVFDSWESFDARTAETGVPLELREVIWRAIENREREEMRAAVADELEVTLSPDKPPTYEEFEEHLAWCKRGGKGAGPSGVPYEVLWRLPEEAKEQLYDKLVEVWRTGEYPGFWGLRWIAPIPKTDNPTVDDLRPIALVETTRKVWNGLLLRRISRALERSGILSDSQYAFRPRRGTDSAILQLVNAIEEAQENRTELFVSSWDTRRAFDSPAKQILVRSWTRLGVPERVAKYLVDIDKKGRTIIKTDIAQEVWDREGIGGFDVDGAPNTFRAVRGTGGGRTSGSKRAI